jgi:hypothetical protein
MAAKAALAAAFLTADPGRCPPEVRILPARARVAAVWARAADDAALTRASFARYVAPIGALTAVDVALSNAALGRLPVPTYTAAKSTGSARGSARRCSDCRAATATTLAARNAVCCRTYTARGWSWARCTCHASATYTCNASASRRRRKNRRRGGAASASASATATPHRASAGYCASRGARRPTGAATFPSVMTTACAGRAAD